MSLFGQIYHHPHRICCGLYPVIGNADDFPLLNARVHYDLIDVQALANLIQTYTSNARSEVEINYVFPLPSEASVCAFKAVVDGKRIIKGIVKEKETAKAEYNEAIAQGKTAALLQQDNVEVFQVSLGNIHPNQTIQVHISFACVLAQDGELDTLRLTFPSIITPRYGIAPNKQLDYSAGVKRVPQHTHFVPLYKQYTFTSALDFSVAVQMTAHIKSITSPSHPITMKLGESTIESSDNFDSTKARVSLSSPTLLEKDIIIVIGAQGLDRPRCTFESFTSEGAQEPTDAYALTLVPRFELPPLPSQEYIFLVDRSGSMGGQKMNAVRSALQIMLMSLPARDTYFNIISFGSRCSKLFPSSIPYSAESVTHASAHVDTMVADHGGTEIKAALETAVSSCLKEHMGKRPTSVFVLTDGEAWDLDGVQSYISDAVSKTKADGGFLRVFCMGIGDAVSRAMCEIIARTGNGTVTFVGESEKPDSKLMGMLRAARGVSIEDISINWGVPEDDVSENVEEDFEIISPEDASQPPTNAAPISLFQETQIPDLAAEKSSLGPNKLPVLPPPPRLQQAPSNKSMTSLYPGYRTSVFAIIRRIPSHFSPPRSVRITGSAQGHPVQLEVPITQAMSPEVSENSVKMLHVLAARALVQRFEDESKSKSQFRSQLYKAKILRVAERYGIASSQTSFVAIDEESGYVRRVTRQIDNTGPARSNPSMAMLFGGAAPVASSSPRQMLFGRATPAASSSPPQMLFGGATPPASSSPPQMLFGGATLAASSFSRNARSPVIRGGGMGFAPFQQQQQQQQQQPNSPAPFIRPQTGGFFGSPSAQAAPPPAPTSLLDSTRDSVDSTVYSTQARHRAKLSAPVPPAYADLPPTVESFARAQSFEGSFTGTPALYQLLFGKPTVPELPQEFGSPDGQKEKIWCTLLCIAYLQNKLANVKDVWVFIYEKAIAWVGEELRILNQGPTSVVEIGDRLLELAKKSIVG